MMYILNLYVLCHLYLNRTGKKRNAYYKFLKLHIFLLPQHPHKPWAPWPCNKVAQCYKAGPHHKFPFLLSPDCDLAMFSHINEIPSCLLFVYCTLNLIKSFATFLLVFLLFSSPPFSLSAPHLLGWAHSLEATLTWPLHGGQCLPIPGPVRIINLFHFHTTLLGVIPRLHLTDVREKNIFSNIIIPDNTQWTSDTCYKIDKPWKRNVKWNKPKDKYCMILLIWGI